MNQSDMDRLRLSAGENVAITGGQLTISRPSGASPKVETEDIQLSKLQYANAGIGSNVVTAKVDYQPALHVTLTPLNEKKGAFTTPLRNWFQRLFGWLRSGQSDSLRPPLNTLLDGVSLVRQDRLQVDWSGRVFQYRVKETVPEGVVVLSGETSFTFEHPAQSPGGSPSYEDVGGLGREIGRVREMVELPMRSPQLFLHLGIKPPKGLLLYGPPGCGKALIARAVERESGAHFINVNGPEIIQKHYGESEELLPNIFAEAQKYQAAIIFFDEIDAVAPGKDFVPFSVGLRHFQDAHAEVARGEESSRNQSQRQTSCG
jgi:hypothetical protein